MLTMKKVNKALEPLGLTLWKGEGYFYFLHTETDHCVYDSSEYVLRLNHLSLEQWISRAEDVREKSIKQGFDHEPLSGESSRVVEIDDKKKTTF